MKPNKRGRISALLGPADHNNNTRVFRLRGPELRREDVGRRRSTQIRGVLYVLFN